MRTLALLVLGCATVAQAQTPKSYTPSTAPRPGEETILNTRVVSVDRAANRLTVRGVDVKADGGSNETFTVAAPAASRLAELKPGMEVLLTLRGTTVIDVKVAVASGGEGGNVIRGGAGTFTLQGSPSPANRTTGPSANPARRTTSTPRTAVTPRPGANPVVSPPPAAGGPGAGAAPGTVPGQGVPATGANPVAGAATTGQVIGAVPTVTGPRGAVIVATPLPALHATPFPTPRPQPTPIPVGTPRPVLLPSDSPSPSQTPTPSPSPQTP